MGVAIITNVRSIGRRIVLCLLMNQSEQLRHVERGACRAPDAIGKYEWGMKEGSSQLNAG